MQRRGWPVRSAIFVLLLSMLFLGACSTPTGQGTGVSVAPARPSTAQLLEAFGRLPLHFEENQGQADASLRFIARTEGGLVGLSPRGMSLVADGEAVQLSFGDAASAPRMAALEPLPGRVNYYRGGEPHRWQIDIPTFARVRYEAIYPGVDVVVYGNQRRLEYDFVVAPGADPARIRVRVDGAQSVMLDEAGDLRIRRGDRTIVQHAPVIYQERDGRREPVAGRYVVRGRDVSFALGTYDRTRPLVIDPVVAHAARVGHAKGKVIAVDAAGHAYVAGESTGTAAYPQVNAAFAPAHCCFQDIVVSKLSPDGSSLIYSTYLGAFGHDEVHGIAVDGAGNAWVVGRSGSMGTFGFPTTPDALFTTSTGGSDSTAGVLVKFGPTGTLLYGTYLRGTSTGVESLPSGACQQNSANGVAVDPSGNVYVVGNTSMLGFPTTPGAYQGTRAAGPQGDYCHGDVAGWAAKFTSGGSLVYSTHLDTAGARDVAYAVAVDAAGNAYVGGTSAQAPPFPITSTLTANGSHTGGWLTKLDATGHPGWAAAVGLIPDPLVLGPDGSIYFLGASGFDVTSPPTTVNALQSTPPGGGDGFAARLNATGTAYHWATYIGGSAADALNGIAADPSGAAWLIGTSASANYPLKDSTQAKEAPVEIVVTKLSVNGTLLFSTFLGAGEGYGVDTDAAGAVYLTGAAGGGFKTTPGVFKTTFDGALDLFVLKYLPDVPGSGGPQSVVWTSPVKVAVSGSTITKNTGCNGCADAGAISQQTFASGPVSLQFKVSSGFEGSVGLSNGNPGTSGSEIKFALRFFSGYVEVRESGVWKQSWTIAAGDTHKVAVDGGVVKYSQNGTVKYTSTVAPVYPLLVDASINAVGAAVQNAVVGGATTGGSTPPTDTTPPTVTLSGPGNGTTVSGTVTVTANAGDNVGVTGVQFKVDGTNIGAEDVAAPYAVSWNTTTLPNGTHTITAVAKDAAGNTKTAQISVTVSNNGTPPTGGSVVWASPVKVTVSGSTITKNSGCNGCWDAGAASQQTIASGNGSVSFTVSTGATATVGLTTGNGGTSANDIKFALRFFPGYVEVRESGVWKESWTIAAGATHKVAVNGGAVKYFYNGALKYTSAVAPAYPLLVDATIETIGSAVQNALLQ
jgi:hypothetical protein